MKISHLMSSKPSKKRKALYNAPLHVKQKLVSVHLSKDLRKSLKKRSIPVRKGDKVFISQGRFKKKEGTVARVDLNNLKIFVEGMVLRKQKGGEKLAPIQPSHVVAIQLVDRKKGSASQKAPAAPKKIEAAQKPAAAVAKVEENKQ